MDNERDFGLAARIHELARRCKDGLTTPDEVDRVVAEVKTLAA